MKIKSLISKHDSAVLLPAFQSRAFLLWKSSYTRDFLPIGNFKVHTFIFWLTILSSTVSSRLRKEKKTIVKKTMLFLKAFVQAFPHCYYLKIIRDTRYELQDFNMWN